MSDRVALSAHRPGDDGTLQETDEQDLQRAQTIDRTTWCAAFLSSFHGSAAKEQKEAGLGSGM